MTATTGVETRANVAYGLLTTADRVQTLVVPTNGVIRVRYRALWKVSGGTAEASIFVGATQVKSPVANGVPVAIEQSIGIGADFYSTLYTNKLLGLASTESGTSDSSFVTTGFIIGGASGDDELTIDGLPAGTYDVSVMFKSNGTVSVKERVLRAHVQTLG